MGSGGLSLLFVLSTVAAYQFGLRPVRPALTKLRRSRLQMRSGAHGSGSADMHFAGAADTNPLGRPSSCQFFTLTAYNWPGSDKRALQFGRRCSTVPSG